MASSRDISLGEPVGSMMALMPHMTHAYRAADMGCHLRGRPM
jgi:hypothetical protein